MTTEIDIAHARMEEDPENDQARLQFYERLADSELFLLLAEETTGETLKPEVFPVEDQSFVLVFDRPDRLAEFVGKPAPYAAMSGRALAGMVAGQGISLGLNLEVAPSAMLLPAEAVDWLVSVLGAGPQTAEARPVEILPPARLPDTVIAGLDRKLATTGGLARFAWLARVVYDTGIRADVLAFVDAVPGAEQALAAAIGEALTFSGVEAGMLDVIFLQSSDPIAAQFAKVGFRFDLPAPVARSNGPKPPGMDPNSPPKLR